MRGSMISSRLMTMERSLDKLVASRASEPAGPTPARGKQAAGDLTMNTPADPKHADTQREQVQMRRLIDFYRLQIQVMRSGSRAGARGSGGSSPR